VSGPGSTMIASCVSKAATEQWRSQSSSSIMSAWKWGVPAATRDEWPAYFAASGWDTVGVDGWKELAQEYGLRPAEQRRSPRPAQVDALPERDRFGMVLAVRA
jgi:hypothetical protein